MQGCATPPAETKTAVGQGARASTDGLPPVSLPELPREPSEGETKLADAITAFDRGEYDLVIRQLTPLVAEDSLDRASQLRALKTLAFSQCVSRALTACRRSFERAFRIDSGFHLAPAEQGHPVWGPQFERARKAVKEKKGE